MNYRSQIFFGMLFTLFALTACVAKPVQPEAAVVPPSVAAEKQTGVDLGKLQQVLGLDGSKEDLGYGEKSFGTCEMGYGFSRNRDCHTQFLVVMRFRLQCRENDQAPPEGVDAQSIHAVTSDRVKWSVGTNQGVTQTDQDGFGVVRFLAPHSQKRKPAKLTVDGHYLVMRAEDMSRMVAPANWCTSARR